MSIFVQSAILLKNFAGLNENGYFFIVFLFLNKKTYS
jgi:hypothetical protein